MSTANCEKITELRWGSHAWNRFCDAAKDGKSIAGSSRTRRLDARRTCQAVRHPSQFDKCYGKARVRIPHKWPRYHQCCGAGSRIAGNRIHQWGGDWSTAAFQTVKGKEIEEIGGLSGRSCSRHATPLGSSGVPSCCICFGAHAAVRDLIRATGREQAARRSTARVQKGPLPIPPPSSALTASGRPAPTKKGGTLENAASLGERTTPWEPRKRYLDL
jgi:hypothetical protein